jgi:hypothetical protein
VRGWSIWWFSQCTFMKIESNSYSTRTLGSTKIWHKSMIMSYWIYEYIYPLLSYLTSRPLLLGLGPSTSSAITLRALPTDEKDKNIPIVQYEKLVWTGYLPYKGTLYMFALFGPVYLLFRSTNFQLLRPDLLGGNSLCWDWLTRLAQAVLIGGAGKLVNWQEHAEIVMERVDFAISQLQVGHSVHIHFI